MQSELLEQVKAYLMALQDTICQGLESADGKAKFVEDNWQRAEGGGGRTRVIQGGNVIEQGGVNYSHVFGASMPASATAHRPELAGRSFHACGVSLVIHPNNPHIPTSHANVRFFIAEKEGEEPIWWFGGGFDLTPYYPVFEDVQHWHQVASDLCQSFGATVYDKYKNWCDEYFYLKHRKEPRGVGGIFFDYLNGDNFDNEFDFIKNLGLYFKDFVHDNVERKKDSPYSEEDMRKLMHKRSRYVEFNLLYDRGTLFGLKTDGNVEAILMSMPPRAEWN